MWDGNKAQAAALESGGAKRILGCSCIRVVAKLKWWYECRSIGIQGSFLCRSGHVEVGKGSIGVRLLTIHWAEWLEDIRKGSCSFKSFLGVAGEGIDERESSKFEEGLNSKVEPFRCIGPLVPWC